MESANIQNGNNTAEGSKQIGNGAEDICVEDNVYLAALRVTAPLASVTAVVSTVAIYVVLGELSIDHINVKNYAVPSGASGVIASIVITIALWFTVALLYRRYTSAASASRRNYNLLREKLN